MLVVILNFSNADTICKNWDGKFWTNGRCASVTVYFEFVHQFNRKHLQSHSLLICHKITRGIIHDLATMVELYW